MGTGIQHKSRTPGAVVNSSAVWAEEHEITGHILPNSPNVYDLGSTGFPFRRLYLQAGGLGGIGIVEAADLGTGAIVTHHLTIDHTAAMLKEGVQPFNSDIEFTPYGTVGGAPDSHDSIQWTAGTIQFADGTTLSIDAGNVEGLATGVHFVYFTVGSSTLTVTSSFDVVSSDTKALLAEIGVLADATQEVGIQAWRAKGLSVNSDALAVNSVTTSALIALSVVAGKISVLGLDANGKLNLAQTDDSLDDVPDGTTYKLVRATDIDGGHLKLTTYVVASGEWYDYSGVEIDSSHGINLYGTANALTTRSTKAGTIQCYVGADGYLYAGAGAVKLNSGGLEIHGQFLKFYAGGILRGYVNASGIDLWISSLNDIIFDVGAGDYVELNGCDLRPIGSCDIGAPGALAFNHGYFDDLTVANFVTANYKSSDGTAGITDTKSWTDGDGATHNVTIKDGLITAWTIA